MTYKQSKIKTKKNEMPFEPDTAYAFSKRDLRKKNGSIKNVADNITFIIVNLITSPSFLDKRNK
jgi:hypothetical protein